MPFQGSMWAVPDQMLLGCETPPSAAHRANELVSRLPVVPQFERWESGARRLLAPCLFAAARHPDPELRGNASLLVFWLSGSGRNLDQVVRTLRQIGSGDGRRAAAGLEETLRSSAGERSAFCSLARSAVLRATMLAGARDEWTRPGSDVEQDSAAGG